MNSAARPAVFFAFALSLEDTRPMRILIVEDELRMLELLRKGLYEHGFTVMTAADGEGGLETATAHELDAIVLDIGLPKMDGYAFMRALRAAQRKTPVLVLTARDSEDEIIRGLDLGADDYLTKPFSFPELVARLQSITRLHRPNADGAVEAGEVAVDLLRQTVTRDNESIGLTRHEFLLLLSLAGQCVPRLALMESVWGKNHTVGPSALDVLVNALRAKMDGPFQNKLIATVRGYGYVFRPSSAAAEEVDA
jgi:DNA-binding response OmpR family regulator